MIGLLSDSYSVLFETYNILESSQSHP